MMTTDETADESTEPATDTTRAPAEHPGTDRPLVRGLTTAVGTFVVFGVGLVFTSFFAAQFAGGTSGSSGLVTASGGFRFVVLLSPVVAVLVGLVLGRGDASPVDAAVASAVGFVAMYFVGVVVASSLYSPSAANLGVGPFAGYTVGVALTGGAAAAVPGRDLSASVGDISVGRPALRGAATVVTYALGFAVSVVLTDTVTGPMGSGTTNVFATPGSEFAFAVGTVGIPVAGVLAGSLGTTADASGRGAAASGAAAGAAGGAAAVVVFYAAAAIVASAGSFPVGQVVGVGVGTALTAAAAAVVAVRD